MNRNAKTNQRIDSVYGIVNVGIDGILTANRDILRDTIEIVGAEEGSTKTERRYERDSGKPKVVSSVPSDGVSSFDVRRALLAYEWVVAVDTNNFMMGNVPCAVCFSHYAELPPIGFEGEVAYRGLSAYLIFGVGESAKSEEIGWHLTLTHDLAPHLTNMGRIAMVVDSELGRHKAINLRQIGYCRGHTLPASLTMVYASADTDKETLQGLMIRACDKNARCIIKELVERATIPALTRNVEDQNFTAFTKIRFLRR